MNDRMVYFMKPVGMDGPIKIGCSSLPKDRLESLAHWCPFPLEIIATRPGTFLLERQLHSYFADLHLHHEWFTAGPKLLTAIDRLRAGAPIDAAVDLSTLTGPIRHPGNNGWPLTRRQYMSYSARARAALKRMNAAGRRFDLPPDAETIIDRLQNRWGFPKPAPLTDAEIARLDEVLANPVEHFVLSRFGAWPPAREPAQPGEAAA